MPAKWLQEGGNGSKNVVEIVFEGPCVVKLFLLEGRKLWVGGGSAPERFATRERSQTRSGRSDPAPRPTRTGRACVGVAGFGFQGVQSVAAFSSVGHAKEFLFAEVHQKKGKQSRTLCRAP